MEQPEGYRQNGSKLVCKLNKAIYGLKHAPRLWFEKLKTTLIKLGFNHTRSDNSLFTKFLKNIVMYILIYVDDFIVTENNESEISNLIQQLNNEFSIKDLDDLHCFLRIEVKRLSNSAIQLSQKKYISEILLKTKMDQANNLPTPMTTKTCSYQKQGENHLLMQNTPGVLLELYNM